MSFAKYQVKIPAESAPEEAWGAGWLHSLEWCEQRAVQGVDWWYLGRGVFEFANEQDAVMFALRWS